MDVLVLVNACVSVYVNAWIKIEMKSEDANAF
jgi:hypothetical protein